MIKKKLSLLIAASTMTLLSACSYDFNCTENAKSCTPNGDAIQICTNGDWKIVFMCENPSRCSASL